MAFRFDLVSYCKLSRFPLVFAAIADSAAGYVICFRNWEWEWVESRFLSMMLLAVISAGLYLFGTTLNDIADRTKDAQMAPTKVIPSGRVSVRSAIAMAVLCLLASLGALVAMLATKTASRHTLTIWSVIVLAILAYDLRWLKVSPVMGAIRGLNFAMGAFVAAPYWLIHGPQPWQEVIVTLPLVGYITALTSVSRLEDLTFGRPKVLAGVATMGAMALAAAVTVPVMAYLLGHGEQALKDVETWPGLVLAWVLIGWLVYRASRTQDRKGVMLLVRDGAAGIIAVDAIIVLSCSLGPAALAVLGLLLPAIFFLWIFKRLA